jgi:hypothetical protein
MYCISGVVKTVVSNPARVDRTSGEVLSEPYDQVQIESARETDGGTKFELTTLVTKYGDDFRNAIGKNVIVPVNVYVNGKGKLSTYELEGAKFAASDLFVSAGKGAIKPRTAAE